MMRRILLALALLAGLHSLSAQPREVYTGVYLMNIYDLNINEYSFYADFYVWFRWKGDIDPTQIEFVNAVEKWGFTVTPFYDTVQVMPDGYNYNGMRIEGRFYHSFELGDFPLDRHPLEIRMEHINYPSDSLKYLPDTATTLIRPDFRMPGWQIKLVSMGEHANAYSTNFGETNQPTYAYSNFSLQVDIVRPVSYFLLKLMLPLLVMVIASLGALYIAPAHVDARFSLPIGGLLSCVFLQQSYSSALPDVGYMVLMDKIYLLSYLLIACILLRVLLASNLLVREQEHDPARMLRRDKRMGVAFLGLYLLFSGLLILLAVLD